MNAAVSRTEPVLKFASIPPHAHPVTHQNQLRNAKFTVRDIRTLLQRGQYPDDALDTGNWKSITLLDDNTLEVAYLSPEQDPKPQQHDGPDRFSLVDALMQAEALADTASQLHLSANRSLSPYRSIKNTIHDLVNQARIIAD